ncbi:MAG: acetolactate synthase [Clostridia bacterium]|nr:acetolactate synthase [Clostridia bacterium]
MAIKQLTVFVENKQGRLVEITEMLASASIDMSALSIADTRDFGILRLIVSDTEKAREVLTENGVLVQITEVVGVKLSDRPGELSRALSVLDRAGINLEYLYAFLAVNGHSAYVALRVENNEAAEAVLREAGFEMVTEQDIK